MNLNVMLKTGICDCDRITSKTFDEDVSLGYKNVYKKYENYTPKSNRKQ